MPLVAAIRLGLGTPPIRSPAGWRQASRKRTWRQTPLSRGERTNPMSSQPAPSKSIAELPPIVAEHIAAVNAFDTDRIVNTFAADAYVNDNRREIWGADAIWNFMDKEIVGDHVTMEVQEIIDNYGDI